MELNDKKILAEVPEGVTPEFFKKCLDDFDSVLNDLFLKHFGSRLEAELRGEQIFINDLKLKNGIPYMDLDNHYPDKWMEFQKIQLENLKKFGGNIRKAVYDSELLKNIDELLTKIENE